MWPQLALMAAGALMGKSNYDAKQAQQKRTANAEADATAASWARKNGVGNIPRTQFNDASELGSIGGGALAGYSMGSQFATPRPDWKQLLQDEMSKKQMYNYIDASNFGPTA